MKRSLPGATPTYTTPVPRRVGVATAKARLSQILRDLHVAPVVIQSRGRDVGVLVGVAAYDWLAADREPHPGGGAFLDSVNELRQRFGGGVDFDPDPAVVVPRKAFSGRRRG